MSIKKAKVEVETMFRLWRDSMGTCGWEGHAVFADGAVANMVAEEGKEEFLQFLVKPVKVRIISDTEGAVDHDLVTIDRTTRQEMLRRTAAKKLTAAERKALVMESLGERFYLDRWKGALFSKMNNVKVIVERLRQLAMATSASEPALNLESGRGSVMKGHSSVEADRLKVYPRDLLDLADAVEYGMQCDSMVRDTVRQVMATQDKAPPAGYVGQFISRSGL